MAPLWLIGAFAGFTFLACYLRSFLLPSTPLLLWGDALGYATKGVRIIEGELPYRDFFDFVTPGTELVYALLFRCFTVRLWVPNLLMCLVASLTAFWLTWVARKLLPRRLVLFPGVLLIGYVLAGSFDATHHWFSTLSILSAMAMLWDGISSRRLLAAGALCGAAASFTQSKGAAAFLALLAYLWWKSRREPDASNPFRRGSLQLCIAAFVIFAAFNLPFLLAAGLHQWYADVIVFPLRYFGTVSANNWHVMALEFAGPKDFLRCASLLFLYSAIPFSYLWTFLWIWHSSDTVEEKTRDQLLLLGLAGSAMLIMVAPALSVRRLSCASPPALILFSWLLSRRNALWQTVAAFALGAVSLAISLTEVNKVQFVVQHRVDLPAGSAVTPDAELADEYRWLTSHTHPGQYYFGMPPYTLPLRLKNPAPIESPAPGDYCRPEQIAAVIRDLEQTRTELLLLRPFMYTPRLLITDADHLQPFHSYLFSHYRRTKIFSGGDEVWLRIRS